MRFLPDLFAGKRPGRSDPHKEVIGHFGQDIAQNHKHHPHQNKAKAETFCPSTHNAQVQTIDMDQSKKQQQNKADAGQYLIHSVLILAVSGIVIWHQIQEQKASPQGNWTSSGV